MATSINAVIVQLLESLAAFTVTSVIYVFLLRTLRRARSRERQIATGAVFALGAALCMFVQRAGGSPPLVNDGAMAVVLAAPFGGSIAAITAAILATGLLLVTQLAPVYPGVAELFFAALLSIAAAEILRRRHKEFTLAGVVALAVLLALGSATLLLPSASLDDLAGQIALTVGVRLPVSTIVFGSLLLRFSSEEKKMAEQERRWQALIANVPGAVIQLCVNTAGEISFPFLSPEATRIFGDAAQEATTDPAKILRAIHPEDRGSFKRSLMEAGQRLGAWSLEFRILEAAGKYRWLRGRAVPHLTPDGDVLWDGIVVNVTGRKDAEKALQQSEQLYRLLAENTTEIVARIGPDERWIYVSPPVRAVLGYEPGELPGQHWLSIVHKEDADLVQSAAARLVPDGRPQLLKYRARRKDGTYLWVEESRRLTGKSGLEERRESIGVIRPFAGRVGERKAAGEANEARREANASFARMLQATNAGVIVTDPLQPDNPIVFANAAATAITGYDAAELIGRNCRILQGPDTDPLVVDQIRAAIREERSISATLVNYRKDGSPFWSKLDISPVRGAEGRLEAFVSVFVDVSDQKKVEEELRRARDVAEQANLAKTEFIASISHELRTPLNGVIGFTNLLLNENLPAEQRRYATFAHDAGSSLLAIINNVLDLAKIEAGKLELTETDFSVVDLAVSCNTVVWHAAREKGLDLNFVLKPDVVNVARGDPDRIRQVLLNLLSNAIKFTKKGSIVLTISKVEDTPAATVLRFSVTDTGIGIAKEKLALLFQKFSQLDEHAGRRMGGTGLGLAICKNLVERMGGTIGVTSTPGVGSKFWFTVPLKPASGAPLRAGLAEIGARNGVRILLAEDVPMNQELMLTLLRRAGHEVQVVGDGEAAIAAARSAPCDLILMDIQLPGIDGLAATRAIRALDGPAGKVPIIAMTARALSKDVERCIAAGMNDHLPKPVDAAALLAIIQYWTRPRDENDVAPPETRPRLVEAAPDSAGTGEPSQFVIQDEATVLDLERHLGADKLAKMRAAARVEIPARLKCIAKTLDDYEKVEREAHDLVSVAGNLGLVEIVARARRLMEICASRDGAQIQLAYAALEAAVERAAPVMSDQHLARTD